MTRKPRTWKAWVILDADGHLLTPNKTFGDPACAVAWTIRPEIEKGERAIPVTLTERLPSRKKGARRGK